MNIGFALIGLGALTILTTLKLPVWLGGPERRPFSDDTASAEVGRASRRSLGGWLIFGGLIFYLVGL